MTEGAPKIRIDKWLWHARFFKTRSLAAKQVSAGHVRLNGTKASKPAQSVAPGDVLTFAQGKVIRVVKVEAIGERRGPAPEAQALYFDMTEKQEKVPANPRFEGKGRPDKKARRALDLTRKSEGF
ncbi:RNA-binding S4 domain-containing protein [Leisingera sp. JC1]|uniref:RNA-binding S4 domain-containing protein n=1 Tax=Leisingera sp. JC1 TaxID=1855282 RepID=UPI0008039D2F|nr:RNA-binding S4 domain-containing protein [Leisingera sp. JC1]OBY24477.1 RNA-binding protein S4 [Leisingera sp. JC1]